ncbi:MAG: ferredoxin [Alphaproteobacteria bacterium TMED87]|nr:ferredoxin [Rhodospirillaceae bacterium]OUV09337.1 MAG: ferredoxin [Alphaproteobacteria bacterium TMED87]|tara:strand:+ start:114 stop:431 length:318 start_codon:yes stop_codon:yes gene_type:complete
MPKIYVTDRNGEKHDLDADAGDSLMEVIRDNDLDIEAICGGCCSCATCHVYIDQEWRDRINEMSDEEIELLEDEQYYVESESRLSCQIFIDDKLDGLVLKVAPPA